MSLVRDAGFTADQFGHLVSARSAMALILTKVEDRLEARSAATAAERARIRDVRRRLEQELHP